MAFCTSGHVVLEDLYDIERYIKMVSDSMSSYIQDHSDSEYVMIAKLISHSDVVNKGKRNGKDEPISKNLLYYYTIEELVDIEKRLGKPSETAKQSNIGVPLKFFQTLNMHQLQRRVGPQKKQLVKPIVNAYANVFLVNDTVEYFVGKYTRHILDILNKKPTWYNKDIDVTLDKTSPFTQIQLSHAAHGIGICQDEEFYKLRMNIFKDDELILLIENNKQLDQKNLFILLKKSPRFFMLMNRG